VKKKTLLIKKFIKIANSCKELGNFNSTAAIIYGLKQPVVIVCTSAWEGLSPKYLETFKLMDSIIDPKLEYKRYWQEIQICPNPAIPFISNKCLTQHHTCKIFKV
jgi:hypothetical protein